MEGEPANTRHPACSVLYVGRMNKLCAFAGSSMFAVLLLGGCFLDGDDDGNGGGEDGTTGSQSNGTRSGQACANDAQCGGPLECQSARCVDGQCRTTFDIGASCLGGDGVCNAEGACQVCAADSECPSLSECQRGACNVTACGIDVAPVGTSCDGGLGFCDASGVCARACTSPSECAATSACHAPTCVGGMCGETPAPAGGACNWFGEPIGTCNATGTCEACQDQACDTIDMYEPNDSQAAAYDLGNRSDCEHHALCGALATAGDVDWYTYFGEDDFGCNVNSTVEFDSPDIRVCQYWACETTPTTQSCPSGTQPDTAPGGQHGCCGNGMWDHDPCEGLAFDDENARVWIKVERLNGSGCSAYPLALEF